MLSDEQLEWIRGQLDAVSAIVVALTADRDTERARADRAEEALYHSKAGEMMERERAALILEAAEALYTELDDAAFGWEMVPLKVQRDAREALDRWRALVGER